VQILFAKVIVDQLSGWWFMICGQKPLIINENYKKQILLFIINLHDVDFYNDASLRAIRGIACSYGRKYGGVFKGTFVNVNQFRIDTPHPATD